MSVLNQDNIRDVAESVGVTALNDEVLNALSGDVEFRMSQVLEEALKFMRNGKRNTLTTQDVSQALRVLDVEPLYGYESTRPLRFGEASIGPGQPLFYVEDEEVDFEKLINAPLPKVPREISFSAHWLAVEGVQPSIPQNPTSLDARNQELLPKGPGTNPGLAAASGGSDSSISVKPQVKHVLSKELQLYFEKVCSALLDTTNEEYRVAALASLKSDPGLHQLVPYFVQWIAEKVTHGLKDLFVLEQMLQLIAAMLENTSLNVDPYVASLVPSVLTCLISPRLGSSSKRLDHYTLRNLAASLLGAIAKKYGRSSATLKPRLARSCLKEFLDPNKALAVHYGAIRGIEAVGKREAVRVLIIPNLKEYSKILQEAISAGGLKGEDADMVIAAIMGALGALDDDDVTESSTMNNGISGDGEGGIAEEHKVKLEEKVGDLLAARIFREGKSKMVKAVLE